jgi:hypothetical protein
VRGSNPANCPQVDEALATFNGLNVTAIASNTAMNELPGYLGLGGAVWNGKGNQSRPKLLHSQNFFFITPVYLQSVQNTMSNWAETETNGEEEAQGLEW